VLLQDCNPDGATVDAEGFVWSAQWDDACLLRIAPDGSVDTRLEIPGQVVSSVMFGGADLNSIFVTTIGDSVHGATPVGDAPGRVLVIEGSGFRGRAEPRFKG
jgi:sugar lactone lactonase YvrE